MKLPKPNSRCFPPDLSRYHNVGVYPICDDPAKYRDELIGECRANDVPVPTDAEIEYARLQGWYTHRTREALESGLSLREVAVILAEFTPSPLLPRGGREDPRELAHLARGLARFPGRLASNVTAVLKAVPAGALFHGWRGNWVAHARSMQDVLTICAAIHTEAEAEELGNAVYHGLKVPLFAEMLRDAGSSFSLAAAAMTAVEKLVAGQVVI